MATHDCTCGGTPAVAAPRGTFVDQSFHVSERLGKKQALTPDGFLVCEDVPIGRTGVMIYQKGEIAGDPIEPDGDGIIRVHRHEDEVFSDTALSSFTGKPVTIDHPPEPVTPQNWKKYAVGSVQNVRRGDGDDADMMIADLLIQDPDAIQAVRSGLREVSCGYDADYDADSEPGQGSQKNIIGNHLALVSQGRCGPRCAIGDSAPPATQRTEMMAGKASYYDRLMAAFHSRDEAGIKAAIKSRDDAVSGEEGTEVGGGGPGGTALPTAGGEKAITININPAANNVNNEEAMNADDGEKKVPAKDAVTTALDKISNQLSGFDRRIGALENGKAAGAKDAKDPDDEEEKEDEEEEGKKKKPWDKAAKDAADPDDEEEEEGKKKSGDKKKTGDASTKDSTDLALIHMDVLARAEILAPGLRTPTFDAKKPFSVTQDSLCALRRRALVGASDDVIKPMMAGRDLSKMTCDAVSIVFDGAVELARIANNARYKVARPGGVNDGTLPNTPHTPAEINEANRAFWAKKGSI